MLLSSIELESEETSLDFEPVETKQTYIRNVNALKDHIQRGDIYEVNYCTGFKAEFEKLNSVALFKKMVEETLAPFSAFVKMEDYELLCTSPNGF